VKLPGGEGRGPPLYFRPLRSLLTAKKASFTFSSKSVSGDIMGELLDFLKGIPYQFFTVKLIVTELNPAIGCPETIFRRIYNSTLSH